MLPIAREFVLQTKTIFAARSHSSHDLPANRARKVSWLLATHEIAGGIGYALALKESPSPASPRGVTSRQATTSRRSTQRGHTALNRIAERYMVFVLCNSLRVYMKPPVQNTCAPPPPPPQWAPSFERATPSRTGCDRLLSGPPCRDVVRALRLTADAFVLCVVWWCAARPVFVVPTRNSPIHTDILD